MKYGTVTVHLQRDGRVFVQTYSRDTNGWWVMNGLPHVLDNVRDARALGQTVLDAIHASLTTTVPAGNYRRDPPDREFLAWLGTDSYAKYAKGVRAVSVDGFFEGDPHVLVTPESNGGARRGFEPMREHRVKLTDLSVQSVGAAVQEALPLAAV